MQINIATIAMAMTLAMCNSTSLAAPQSPASKRSPSGPTENKSATQGRGPNAAILENAANDIMENWIRRLVSIGPGLDSALRSDVERLTQLLMTRMRAVVIGTLADSKFPKLNYQEAGNRALHELAILSRAKISQEHAELWQLALEDDAFCRPPSEEESWAWSERFHSMRNLPPTQRKRLIELEEQLIQKLGTLEPNTELPFDIDQIATLYREGGATGNAPWAPILTLHLLPTKPEYLSVGADVPRVVQCYGQQMAYRNAGADQKALDRFRAGTALTLSSITQFSRKQLLARSAAGGPYPRLAQQYGVTGTLQVEVSFGPTGKAVGAKVRERHLLVPGVPPNTTPYAYWDLLDEASIAVAIQTRSTDKPQLFGKTAIVPLDWRFAE